MLNSTQIFVFFVVNFLLFQFLFIYLRKNSKQFQSVDAQIQPYVVIRLFSAIHAAIVTISSFYILYYDNNLFQNKLIYSSFEICFILNFSIGYLAFDTLIMSIYRNEFEWNFLVHHFVAIVSFHSCSNAGVFPFIALFRLTSEGSTPFLHARWILLTLNKKNSKLFVTNGLILLVSFFLVRIVTIVPNWYLFFDSINSPAWYSIELKYKLICVVSCIPLDILNVYWFSKIISGALKFFAKKSKNCDKNYPNINGNMKILECKNNNCKHN